MPAEYASPRWPRPLNPDPLGPGLRRIQNYILGFMTEGEQMQPSLKRSRLVLLSLMVFGALFFAVPAIAQTVLGTFTTNSSGVFTGAVTIPSGTAPGLYDLIATGTGPLATPYPPTTTGGLSVSRTVVEAGDSITVSGAGFAPNTSVVVGLSARLSAASNLTIAQVSRTLTARIRVVAPGTDVGGGNGGGSVVINNDNRVTCTSNATATASAGYTIAQVGDININNNNSAKCESTASAVKKIENTPVTKPVTKVLARTGVDALPLLAAALATILLGSVLLSAGRRRGRFEGTLGSA